MDAALARGHELTLFNRGRCDPALFMSIEQLRGDRDGDLQALHGRRWNAVIDTCGYLPQVVRRSAECLRTAVGRYLFVSSISVYADMAAPGQTEDAPLAALPQPVSDDVAQHYGALKAACEAQVQLAFGPRALLVRPGLIVGPFDPSGRFTYWVQRLARGGEVLAPDTPEYPVQYIDARDLALWMVQLLERDVAGTFNACGPAEPTSFGDVLSGCRAALDVRATLIWVDANFLAQHEVTPWTELPLWAGPGAHGLNAVSNARALAAGLSPRPLADTVLDTARWAATAPLPEGIGISAERERQLLQAWAERGPG